LLSLAQSSSTYTVSCLKRPPNTGLTSGLVSGCFGCGFTFCATGFTTALCGASFFAFAWPRTVAICAFGPFSVEVRVVVASASCVLNFSQEKSVLIPLALLRRFSKEAWAPFTGLAATCSEGDSIPLASRLLAAASASLARCEARASSSACAFAAASWYSFLLLSSGIALKK